MSVNRKYRKREYTLEYWSMELLIETKPVVEALKENKSVNSVCMQNLINNTDLRAAKKSYLVNNEYV